MTDATNTAYPADRWIRLTMVDGKLVPAFAPEAARDALQAYEPFLYASEDEIKNEIAREMETRWGEVARNERDFDDADMDDVFGPCTVHEDGGIALEQFEIERAEIFAAYGVEDPAASPAPAL